MSASIYWQPCKGTYLNVGGGKSSFLNTLEKIFKHSGPYEFGQEDRQRLEIAAALTNDSDHSAALLTLVEGIDLHRTISVWAEY